MVLCSLAVVLLGPKDSEHITTRPLTDGFCSYISLLSRSKHLQSSQNASVFENFSLPPRAFMILLLTSLGQTSILKVRIAPADDSQDIHVCDGP